MLEVICVAMYVSAVEPNISSSTPSSPPSSSSPVDEAPSLQVGHARRDLRGHVHKRSGADLLLVAATQVVQQVAVCHELCDDVEWRFPGTDTCRNTQVFVYSFETHHRLNVLYCMHMQSLRLSCITNSATKWERWSTSTYTCQNTQVFAILSDLLQIEYITLQSLGGCCELCDNGPPH